MSLHALSLEENKATAHRFLDEVLNRRDLEAAAQFLADGVVDHLTGSLTACLALAAFPDFHISIEHMVAEGNDVTVLSTFTGTHRGELMGIAATSKGVTGRAAFNFRFDAGTIVEIWTEFEPWGLLQQLRTVPVG